MSRQGAARKPSFFLVGLSALTLAWFVVLGASWNLGMAKAGSLVPSSFPDDPSITFKRAMSDLRTSKGKDSSRILPSIDRSVHLDPLDARPFFFHAFEQLVAKPKRPPVALLEAARRRDPRFDEARLLLLDAYGRNARAKDAIGEAQSLITLMPAQRTLIVRLVAGLAAVGDERQKQSVAHALATTAIRGEVMQRLASTGTNSETLQAFAEPMRGLARNSTERAWIGSFVESVARRPDTAAARSLWATFYDVDPSGIGIALSNPDFSRTADTPPFGWRLSPGRAGIAEIRGGVLDVYAYGRSSGTFATQMLMLAPGDYDLTSRLSSSGAAAPRNLYWQIVCLEGGEPLVKVQLSAFRGPAGASGVPFKVPSAGCSAQFLELAGGADERLRSDAARIERVAIEKAAT